MITVTLNRKAETLSLCVTGHAGFASMGQDIVCAAASILVYTAAELALDCGILTGTREQEPLLEAELELKQGPDEPFGDFVRGFAAK